MLTRALIPKRWNGSALKHDHEEVCTPKEDCSQHQNAEDADVRALDCNTEEEEPNADFQ